MSQVSDMSQSSSMPQDPDESFELQDLKLPNRRRYPIEKKRKNTVPISDIEEYIEERNAEAIPRFRKAIRALERDLRIRQRGNRVPTPRKGLTVGQRPGSIREWLLWARCSLTAGSYDEEISTWIHKYRAELHRRRKLLHMLGKARLELLQSGESTPRAEKHHSNDLMTRAGLEQSSDEVEDDLEMGGPLSVIKNVAERISRPFRKRKCEEITPKVYRSALINSLAQLEKDQDSPEPPKKKARKQGPRLEWNGDGRKRQYLVGEKISAGHADHVIGLRGVRGEDDAQVRLETPEGDELAPGEEVAKSERRRQRRRNDTPFRPPPGVPPSPTIDLRSRKVARPDYSVKKAPTRKNTTPSRQVHATTTQEEPQSPSPKSPESQNEQNMVARRLFADEIEEEGPSPTQTDALEASKDVDIVMGGVEDDVQIEDEHQNGDICSPTSGAVAAPSEDEVDGEQTADNERSSRSAAPSPAPHNTEVPSPRPRPSRPGLSSPEGLSSPHGLSSPQGSSSPSGSSSSSDSSSPGKPHKSSSPRTPRPAPGQPSRRSPPRSPPPQPAYPLPHPDFFVPLAERQLISEGLDELYAAPPRQLHESRLHAMGGLNAHKDWVWGRISKSVVAAGHQMPQRPLPPRSRLPPPGQMQPRAQMQRRGSYERLRPTPNAGSSGVRNGRVEKKASDAKKKTKRGRK